VTEGNQTKYMNMNRDVTNLEEWRGIWRGSEFLVFRCFGGKKLENVIS
jgi:hypothetical protein